MICTSLKNPLRRNDIKCEISAPCPIGTTFPSRPYADANDAEPDVGFTGERLVSVELETVRGSESEAWNLM